MPAIPKVKLAPSQCLKKARLFCSLSDDELNYLGNRAVLRSFTAGELVFSEGDHCEGLYLVESGSIKIFESSATGREQVLLIEGPGSSVGELPLLDGGNYPASAEAVSDSELLLVRTEDLRDLCLRHPEVAVKILRTLASRLRSVLSVVQQLCFSTVRQRLVALLLQLAESRGNRTRRGIEFRITSTNRDLASQIGTVPELVSRNLGALQASGLIKVEGKTVIISSLEVLKAEVEGHR